ncbi:hypothetical protein ACOSQ3_012828 [Xanthoceras sorbifolium]
MPFGAATLRRMGADLLATGFLFAGHEVHFDSFIALALWYKNNISFSIFEVLCVTWWRNWFLRNEVTHSAAPRLSSDVVQWAASYLQDFKAAKVGSATSSTRPVKDFKWHPPAADVYKVNCDVGVDAAAHRTGIRVVIRDSSGFVLASCAQGLDIFFSPQIAVALAIKRSLTLAIETGFTRVYLESDASAVVNLITSRC